MTRQRLLALINYDINQRMKKIIHPILLYNSSFSCRGVIYGICLTLHPLLSSDGVQT